MKLLAISLLLATSISSILQSREEYPDELPDRQEENLNILIRGHFRPLKIKKNGNVIVERTIGKNTTRASLAPSGKVKIIEKKQSSIVTKFILAAGMLYAAKKISDIIGLTSICQKIISSKKS